MAERTLTAYRQEALVQTGDRDVTLMNVGLDETQIRCRPGSTLPFLFYPYRGNSA